MKKYLQFAVCIAAAAASVGCNKNTETVVKDVVHPGTAEISLALAGNTCTKATVDGTGAENAVRTVDIFVFFKGGEYDGQLDAYAHFDSAPYSLTATTGDRTIYAVVNSAHPVSELETVSTKTGLLSKVTEISSQKTASAAPGNFTEIYLSNAVDKEKYSLDLTPAADDFVNKLGVPDAACDLWMRRPIGETLADGESKNMGDAAFSMYAMPNPVDTDNDEKPFTVRNTKLVVKAVLNAKPIYYVIPLGALESNTTYDIGELVITRPGSSDPEKKTETASCTFTVEANPWTVVPLETEAGKYVI